MLMIRRFFNQRLYILIFVLFALAMTFQIAYSVSSLQRFRTIAQRVGDPFALRLNTDQIDWVNPALVAAGVKPGDRILAIDGQPYQGGAARATLLDSKRPGGSLSLKVLRAGHSQPEIFTIPLQPVAHELFGFGPWLITAVLVVITPLSCVLLGFGVLAIRPRDPLAWLLLALMLSFEQMCIAGDAFRVLIHWPDGVRPIALAYHEFFGQLWAICMLVFGIYFPERAGYDRRFPWLKWILIAPLAVHAVILAAMSAADAENHRLLAWLLPLADPFDRAATYLGMVAVSGFFFSLWPKIFQASTADARRRLVLVMYGCGLALLPIFGLVLGRLAGATWVNKDYIWISCLLMLAVFPFTLAYVIVVQRALDVRVVLRQGLQYALATRGIRVLQALFVLAVVLTASALLNGAASNRPLKIAIMAAGVALVTRAREGADYLRRWTDRRFFREAYKTEQILSELGDKVRTIVETRPLLKTVADQISESLHVTRIAMLMGNNGHYEPAYAVGYAQPPETTLAETSGAILHLKGAHAPLRVYFDDPDSWLYHDANVTDAERRDLAALNPELLLPLAFKERLMGVICLGAKRSEEPYSNSDLQLLETVATQTGLALENSQLTEAIASEVALRERANRELEIAREVQERLFPQSYPHLAGVDLAGRCRPALGVGGDYYDYLELPAGALGIAIGDISGKGIPAALLMASLQASLRGQTINGSSDLAALMGNINRLIFNTSPANRYATFFYAQYDPATRRLLYANGGHNPPMLFRGDEVLRLEEGGPVVGLFKPAVYSQGSIAINPGDVLILFTDGISEAMNAADDEWGEEQLIESVRACLDRPAIEMIDRLIRDADAFVAGAPQHDDMTLMVAKFEA